MMMAMGLLTMGPICSPCSLTFLTFPDHSLSVTSMITPFEKVEKQSNFLMIIISGPVDLPLTEY